MPAWEETEPACQAVALQGRAFISLSSNPLQGFWGHSNPEVHSQSFAAVDLWEAQRNMHFYNHPQGFLHAKVILESLLWKVLFWGPRGQR